MKNGNLTQFLDTGWYTEAVLYFDGHVYWCEGATDFETGITTFFVDSWKAECDGKNYHQYQNESGKLIDCKRVLEITGYDHDRIKQQFLTAPVFDGKTFWQVEKDLIWVEEGSSIHPDQGSLVPVFSKGQGHYVPWPLSIIFSLTAPRCS